MTNAFAICLDPGSLLAFFLIRPHNFAMQTKAIVVIDMQVDFVKGALGFPGAVGLDEKIAGLLTRLSGYDIYFTLDTHHSDYLTTEEGKRLPVPHCLEGTPGYKLIPALLPFVGPCNTFKKETFGSLDLALRLKEKGYQEVLFCGIDSAICVFSNAVLAKAALPNAKIKVLRRYCASSNPEAEQNAYKALQYTHIDIIEGEPA